MEKLPNKYNSKVQAFSDRRKFLTSMKNLDTHNTL